MHRFDRHHRMLGYGIAVLAGFVDSTGFLAASHYFVSFMSGNTTRLGVDIVTDPFQAIIPALLIGGFVSGVVLGSLAADWKEGWHKTVVLTFTTTLLILAAMLRLGGYKVAFLGFTVVAMGVLNNTYRIGGEVVVGVTYMTGALVRFGQGLAGKIAGRERPGWLANGLLWLSLATGAVTGAAASVWAGWYPTHIAATAAALLAISAYAIERRDADQPS